MVSESVSERRLLCQRISDVLVSGAVDRAEVLRMVNDLVDLMHEMSREVSRHINGQDNSPEMQQADRWLVSGKSSLQWAQTNAPFALTFELARCVKIANGEAMKIVERLRLRSDGAAA